MAKQLAPAVKILLGAGVLTALTMCAGVLGLRHFAPDALESVNITEELGGEEFASADIQATGDETATIGGTEPARVDSAEIRWGVIPWMSMSGINHANGGPVTMRGSITERWGVNLRIIADDMYGNQREKLIACATEMHQGKKDNCSSGYTHTAMMGDAAAWYVADLNVELMKLGPEYRAEIIGGFGRSLGEDAFMGPKECVKNPDACRGLRFGGVQGDGDINCGISWAAANEIPINPDGSTWDPDAINFYYTNSFNEGDSAYISGFCEDLPVVQNGKRTGKTENVCISGTATWTPGDVRVAREKGGLVKLFSTYENSGQMPNAVFGIYKWNQAHKTEVVNWLAAGFEGGLEIRTDDEALVHAGEVAFATYGSTGMSARDWARYYNRRLTEDAQGEDVWLGGSQAFVLEEALDFYGINPEAGEPFKRSYTYYGDMAVKLWPGDISSFPPFEDVFNPEYLQAVSELETIDRGTEEQAKAKVDYKKASTGPKQVIANKSWNIQFKTGSAKFEADTERELRELADQLVLAGNTKVEIHGHTDDRGGEEANLKLSEDRAFAVQRWLRNEAPGRFTQGSTSVHSHGENNPLVANNSAQARAKNRRVEIWIVTR